ncbi:hypothetical protein MRB53_010271 [Persea americana]|uniref:Uncharacterized protein n=1 Tax=Persea americana TaxID=3435 RepID=A0ACC2LRH6_PERAE|nr:hypothetical protein MRB53_010271 [Persea americana]
MRGRVSPRHLFPSSFALPLAEMPNEKETATENKGVMRGRVSPRHLFPSSFALPLGEMPNEKETANEIEGVMRGRVSPRHLFPSSFALQLGEMPNEKETANENEDQVSTSRSERNQAPKFDSWVAHLCPGFTTSNVVAALLSQSDPDLALDLFRWISQQRGYCPDPLAYLAIIDIIASGKRFSAAESLRASLATLLIKSAISSPYCNGHLKNLIILDLSNMSLTGKIPESMGTDEEVKVHGIGKQPAHRLYVLQFHCLLACLPLLFPYEIDQKGSICFCAGYMFCNFIACLRASLFFFHMKLIRKGITTYEYVVAMRAMSEAPAGSIDDDNQNVIYSPSGSATTGFSGGSSLGLQYKGAWCTPPRVFVDHQFGASVVLPVLVPQILVFMVRVRLDMIANLSSCDRIIGAGGLTVL